MVKHWLILRVDEQMNHTWLIARTPEERTRAAKHPDTMYILPWREEVSAEGESCDSFGS